MAETKEEKPYSNIRGIKREGKKFVTWKQDKINKAKKRAEKKPKEKANS